MIGIFSWFRGKDLDKDEEFQARIADPESRKIVYGESMTLLGKTTVSEPVDRHVDFHRRYRGGGGARRIAVAAAAGRRQAAVDGADDPDVHAAWPAR